MSSNLRFAGSTLSTTATIDENDVEVGDTGGAESQILKKALRSAGEDGIVTLGSVEVYLYREEYGNLKLIDQWMSDDTKAMSHASKVTSKMPSPKNHADSEENEDSNDHRKEIDGNENDETTTWNDVEPVKPGTGLVGTLWSSMAGTSNKRRMYSSSTRTLGSSKSIRTLGSGKSMLNFGSNKKKEEERPEEADATTVNAAVDEPNTSPPRRGSIAGGSSVFGSDPSSQNQLFWLDLTTIQVDPDTWTCNRLKEQIQVLQLSKASGSTFTIDGVKGLVVFYSTVDTDKEILKSALNTTYLSRMATYIGSIVALEETKRSIMEYKKREMALSWKIPRKEAAPKGEENEEKSNGADAEILKTDDTVENTSPSTQACARIVGWYNKCWGAGLQIPPPMEPQQVMWTLIGSFCGMLVLSLLSELFFHLTDEEYFLVIGPFGAQMTLLYALHSAPASQPRNVILGEVIAGAVSMSISYIPMPKWARRAVCPAFGISAMTAAGVTHPPAGAHATIWADNDHNWLFYLMVVLGSAISVIPATIINNMSLKRQYPIYWGYLPKWLYRKIWKED